MKIHTTQNLNSSGRIQSTNSVTIPNEEIRLNYSERIRMQKTQAHADTYEGKVSFKRKNVLNTAANAVKKSFGERVANTKVFKNIVNSGSFDRMLKIVSDQEVMIQAATALGLCCVARPLAILSLPSGKNKKDNAYAATHSISSGVLGFIIPLLCIKPVANGYSHALANASKYIEKDDTLKKIWPHLDIKSVRDKAGKRLEQSKWLDIEGNKFIADIKDVRKVPLPKHISSFSETTLKKIVPNLDIAKSKNLPVNEWVDTNGKKLIIENLDFKDIYIATQEHGKETKYYPLMLIKENLLKEFYPDLNINSIKGADGKRIHPAKWLKNNGEKFEMPLDNVFLSRWEESDKVIPLIIGDTRKEGKSIKDICYQKNNNEWDPYSLGTAITSEMTQADVVNSIKNKLGGWLPDIVVAYPRATATIALIPFILKNILGMEKSKKPEHSNEIQSTEKNNMKEVA